MDVDVGWTRSTPHLLFVIYVMVLHTLVGVPHLPCAPPCCHTPVRHNAGVRPMWPYVQWLRRPLSQHSQPSSLMRIVLARKMLANWTPVACSSIGWKYLNCGLCSGSVGSVAPLRQLEASQHAWLPSGRTVMSTAAQVVPARQLDSGGG